MKLCFTDKLQTLPFLLIFAEIFQGAGVPYLALH